MPNIRKYIEELGRPILLERQFAYATIYVDYGGLLFLGDRTMENFKRPRL